VLAIRFRDGRRARALTYTADRSHLQYASGLSVEDAARTCATSEGKSGHNADYVRNTVAHLRELGIRDHWMEAVAGHMDALLQAG
jgi:cation transport protein ChaC